MKTNLTKEIEKSIILTSKATGPGVYGCLEVTLGKVMVMKELTT